MPFAAAYLITSSSMKNHSFLLGCTICRPHRAYCPAMPPPRSGFWQLPDGFSKWHLVFSSLCQIRLFPECSFHPPACQIPNENLIKPSVFLQRLFVARLFRQGKRYAGRFDAVVNVMIILNCFTGLEWDMNSVGGQVITSSAFSSGAGTIAVHIIYDRAEDDLKRISTFVAPTGVLTPPYWRILFSRRHEEYTGSFHCLK